jgi:hypothetical protein
VAISTADHHAASDYFLRRLELPPTPAVTERIKIRLRIRNRKRKRIIRINIGRWIRRRMTKRVRIIRIAPIAATIAMTAIATTVIADSGYSV